MQQRVKSSQISQNVLSAIVRIVKDSTYIYYIDGMNLTFLDLSQQPFVVQTPYLITVVSSRKQKTKKINYNTNNYITLNWKPSQLPNHLEKYNLKKKIVLLISKYF